MPIAIPVEGLVVQVTLPVLKVPNLLRGILEKFIKLLTPRAVLCVAVDSRASPCRRFRGLHTYASIEKCKSHGLASFLLFLRDVQVVLFYLGVHPWEEWNDKFFEYVTIGSVDFLLETVLN